MGQLVFAFYSPVDVSQTTDIIRQVVKSMNGKIECVSNGHLIGAWRTQKNHSRRYHSVFPTKCHFYIGTDMVRAVISTTVSPDMIGTYRHLRKEEIVWNAFIESLNELYPDLDFGLKLGRPVLDAIQFVGDGIEQVYTSISWNSPSWGSVLIGGLLFGTAGAVIGGMNGTTRSTGKSSVHFSNVLLARARYTNGLYIEGTVVKGSSTYHEIIANMNLLTN